MVEILVAISLLGLFGAATVPLLISGLRASVVAKLDTGAKNLSQQRFELMRNLPFRIAYDPAINTGVDLLDTYYPNLVAPTGGFETAGYVTTQPRRTGEPGSGPFYRTVFVQTLGSTTYTQYVATQFLTPDVTPKQGVTPPSGYSTTSVGNDRAPSTLVGVTVVTEWTYGTKSKRYTVYSEISDVAPGPPLVTMQARATALRVSSTVGLDVDQTDLLLETGVINIDGGLSSGANAASSATGGFASSTPGLRVDGANATVSAPPEQPAISSGDLAAHSLEWNGETVAVVPRTEVSDVDARTAFGDPIAGTSTNPVQAASYGNEDLRFTNRPNLDPALGLDAEYVVRQLANGGTQQSLSTAHAGSIGGVTHSAQVSLHAETSEVRVLPTSFSPEGLVKMTLGEADLTCATDGTAASTSPSYAGEVSIRTYTYGANPAAGVYGWTTYSLSSAQASDQLAMVSLTAGPGGHPVGWNGARVVYLGEYVQGLSSQTASSLLANRVVSSDFNRIEARSTSMLNLSTVPLRAGEPLSAVNVGLGVMSCIAEDNR